MVCPLHLSGLGISCAIRQLGLNNQPAKRMSGFILALNRLIDMLKDDFKQTLVIVADMKMRK